MAAAVLAARRDDYVFLRVRATSVCRAAKVELMKLAWDRVT